MTAYPEVRLEILAALAEGPASTAFLKGAVGRGKYMTLCLKSMRGDGLVTQDERTGCWAQTVAGAEYLASKGGVRMTPLEALEALGDGEHTALEVAGRMGIAYNDRAGWKQVRAALVEASERGECVKTRHPSLGVRFASVPEAKTSTRGRPPVKRVKILRSMEHGPVSAKGVDAVTLSRLQAAGLARRDGGFAEITDAGRAYLEKWRSIA